MPDVDEGGFINTPDGQYGVSYTSQVGIYLTGKVSATGTVEQKSNDCNPADSCLTATLGATGAIGLEAKGKVVVCAALSSDKQCAGGELKAFGEASVNTPSLSYSSCTGGSSSGDFCFGGLTGGASGTVFITIDKVKYPFSITAPEFTWKPAGGC